MSDPSSGLRVPIERATIDASHKSPLACGLSQVRRFVEISLVKSSASGESANLDLLRASAVLSVFSAHLSDALFKALPGLPHIEENTWHFGQLGVLMFFVHTSMVLMSSLGRQLKRGESLFRDFYIRRAFRIYPLSIFCVTVAFVLSGNYPAVQAHWTWSTYLANLLLTQNLFYMNDMIGALWTLPLEVQMYLVLPILFLLARSQSIWALFAVWVIAVAAGIVEPYFTRRLGVLEYAPCFVAGVIAWRLSRSAPTSIGGWAWPAALAAISMIFILVSKNQTGERLFYDRWAFCLALGITIPLFQDIRLRPLNHLSYIIAKYSYGIYLTHGALLVLAFSLPVALPVQMIVLAVTMVIVPYVLFHTIEEPLTEFGRRIVARRRTGDVGSPEAAQN